MDKPHRNRIYEFENFRLDAAHLLLYKDGREISLTPKVVETLLALVERGGEVLSKDELMEIVWTNSFVEESNLSQNLYILRKILSETADGRPLIETLKRRGYRFNGDVVCLESNAAKNSPTGTNQSSASKNIIETSDRDSENEGYQTPTTADPEAIVGREKEIAQIKNLLLQTDVRLVTLAGVGGTGKTKLAQAVAREMANEFSDGVFFIELAAITDHELVAPTIAQQFGIKETSGKSVLENLMDYLRDKNLLIVADNFEQVVDDAPTIVKLLTSAENVKFLITSRVLLRVRAEKEFIVPPLALPDENSNVSLDELAHYEAIRLFVERARNAKPNFALTEENAGAVAEICRRLDGLPLAIELAAARLKILAPPAILAKLENRLKLLTGGASDLPARQQTMRGAIEWSYDLLTENEKHLFRHLAVFAGGFTFEAAEAVCGNYESNANQKLKSEKQIEVLDSLTSLIDKSLLTSKDRTADEQRFQMLEIFREYALESLEKNAEAETVKRRHAAYFLALGEEAEPHLTTAEAGKWLERLEDEHNNLRSAMRRLLENDAESAARLAAAIRIYLINHNHLSEGREWLAAVLEASGEMTADVRFNLFYGLGYLAIYQGDYAAARKNFEAALTEAEKTNDRKRIAESLRGLGTVAYSQGGYAAARNFFEEGLVICRALNYQFGTAALLNSLGSLALDEDDSETARTLFEESLNNFRSLGNENAICFCLLNLGVVAYSRGDYAAAQTYYSETMVVAQNSGYKDRVSLCLDGFAALALRGKDCELAAKLAGAAEYLREQISYESEPIDRNRRNAYLAELKTKTSETAFNEFYNQGRELKLEKAVALCQKWRF